LLTSNNHLRNSSYEIRNELVKTMYGTADRRTVMADGETITSAHAELASHFAGRPAVESRIKQAIELEATGADPRKLAELQKSIKEQFGYDKYTEDTLVRLARDNVTYTEQSNSIKKLRTRFDEGQLDWAKARAKVAHPELAKQLDALEVKHLAMITTNNLGGADANVNDGDTGPRTITDQGQFEENLAGIESMQSRHDVVGMDVAGMEHYQFSAEGQARFEKFFYALRNAARKRGDVTVLRPHVGEGANDTTVGDSYNRDGNRQVVDDGTSELTNYRRARENIESLVKSLEKIAKDNGGTLPPEVIVRFGHATHATPSQAARMAELGVIVEVNLGSNQATGAVAANKPAPGEQDVHIDADTKAPLFSDSKLPTLEDHSLATLIFNKVEVTLNTDGHDVMNTTMAAEFKRGSEVLERIRIDDQKIRISVEQARAMNNKGGHAAIPATAAGADLIEVTYSQLSIEKRSLFDKAYRNFFETAQKYVDHRPKQGSKP
jgi:hypothetical protein